MTDFRALTGHSSNEGLFRPDAAPHGHSVPARRDRRMYCVIRIFPVAENARRIQQHLDQSGAPVTGRCVRIRWGDLQICGGRADCSLDTRQQVRAVFPQELIGSQPCETDACRAMAPSNHEGPRPRIGVVGRTAEFAQIGPVLSIAVVQSVFIGECGQTAIHPFLSLIVHANLEEGEPQAGGAVRIPAERRGTDALTGGAFRIPAP